MTEAVEKTPAAAAKAAAKPAKAKAAGTLVVSLMKVDGIEPGTPLLLDNATYKELLDLEAVRDATEAETALYEKTPESVVKITKPNADADLDAALEG